MSAGRFEPVRVGVAGVGNFGLLHAQTLRGLAEAELVAVVHRRQERLDEVAAELPGVPGWTSLDEALTASDAEAWVVAASSAAHVPMARAILESGRPALVEKPLSESLAEAETLKPLVREDSANLMLGHILLFSSEFQQLRDEIRQRGDWLFLDTVRHRATTTMELLPGEHPLHLLMVHDLYATQVLVDRAEPVGFDCAVHRREGGAVDLATARLTWADGRIARFGASFLTPAGMAPDGYDRLEVFGADWAARVSPNPRPIEVWDDRARWPMALEIRTDPAAPMGMLAEELRCFCRVVRGLHHVPVGATYQDALQVQRWLDRLEAAAESGR